MHSATRSNRHEGRCIANSYDGCSAECFIERCGDGVLQPRDGELCDGTPECASDCTTSIWCPTESLCFDLVVLPNVSDAIAADVDPTAPGSEVIGVVDDHVVIDAHVLSAPVRTTLPNAIKIFVGAIDATGDGVAEIFTAEHPPDALTNRARDMLMYEAPAFDSTFVRTLEQFNAILGDGVLIPRSVGLGLAISVGNAGVRYIDDVFDTGAPLFDQAYPDPVLYPGEAPVRLKGLDDCGETLVLSLDFGRYALPPAPTLYPGPRAFATAPIVWDGVARVLLVRRDTEAVRNFLSIHECDDGLTQVTVLDHEGHPDEVVDLMGFLATGDLDGDAIDDVVGTGEVTAGIVFLSSMAFAPATIPARGRISLADIDGDGLLDIFADSDKDSPSVVGFDVVFRRQAGP